MGLWAYGVLEGRQVDRWLASRAGWRADVLRDRTQGSILKSENRVFFYYEVIKNTKINN